MSSPLRPSTLLAALLLALPASGALQTGPLELRVHRDGDWWPAAGPGAAWTGTPAWPLPLTTRSPQVVTAELGRDGIGLQLTCPGDLRALGRVELFVIPHRLDQQVLQLDGVLTLVDRPDPVSEDPGLARQDALLGPAEELAATDLRPTPPGATLVAIPAEAGTRRATALEPGAVAAGSLDQLFTARVTDLREVVRSAPAVRNAALVTTYERTAERRGPLPALRGGPSAPPAPVRGPRTSLTTDELLLPLTPSSWQGRVLGRGRSLELWLEVPPFPAGPDGARPEAWTLCVGVETSAAPAPTPSEPAPPASAVVAPREALPPAPWFADVTGELLGLVAHHEGPEELTDLGATQGPGLALGDVDDDGQLDLVLVQGSGSGQVSASSGSPDGPPDAARSAHAPARPTTTLLLGPAPGSDELTWRPVRPSGLEVPAAGMGALLFDADGDGDLDLYQANRGPDHLFANRWNQRPPELAAGLTPFAQVHQDDFDRHTTTGWSAGVAAGDLDLDGDLDLVVAGYLDYDAEVVASSELAGVALEPRRYAPGASLVLLNESGEPSSAVPAGPALTTRRPGALHLRNATAELGLAAGRAHGLQPLLFDRDGDGDLDLFLTSDGSADQLWRNELIGPTGARSARGLSFREVAAELGLDDARHSHGVALGDLDRDGQDELFVTNARLEPNALWQPDRRGGGRYTDRTVEAGLGPAGIGATAWGAELLDADNDADLDLYLASGGRGSDGLRSGLGTPLADRLFLGDGAGRFQDAGERAGLAEAWPSRAAVAADLDGDGDLDLVVSANNGPFRVLRNQHMELAGADPDAEPGHWLVVRLAGAGRNTRGIGAEVTVVLDRRDGTELRQRQTLLAGRSYLAGNPPELFFGLGEHAEVRVIEVRWPSGRTSSHGPGPADRVLVLAEPARTGAGR